MAFHRFPQRSMPEPPVYEYRNVVAYSIPETFKLHPGLPPPQHNAHPGCRRNSLMEAILQQSNTTSIPDHGDYKGNDTDSSIFSSDHQLTPFFASPSNNMNNYSNSIDTQHLRGQDPMLPDPTWPHRSDMPLPPELTFPSLSSLEHFIQRWTRFYGYVFVVSSGRKSGRTISVRCGRGGSYENQYQLTPATRQRKAASLKCDCPAICRYKLVEINSKSASSFSSSDAHFNSDSGSGSGKWRIVHPQHPEYRVHNHERLTPGTLDAKHRLYERRANAELMETMEELLRKGMPPRQVVDALREGFPHHIQTTMDVSNFKKKVVGDDGNSTQSGSLGLGE